MQPLGRNTICICNLILSRLAGNVYSFFQRFQSWINNVQVLWDCQNRWFDIVIVGYLYLNDSSRSETSEERDNFFFEIHIAREMYVNVRGPLPSPCTAFSQSLSVNSLRLDQTARHALAARNNEAKGLGNVDCTARKKHDSDSYATCDATIDDVTATAKQIYDISGWQSQSRHRLWRRVASRFLGNATSTGYKGQNVRSSFLKNVYCWWITTDSRHANNV